MFCPRCGNLRTSNRCGWCGYDYKWDESIRKRQSLIRELHKMGFTIKGAKMRKLKELEGLLMYVKENWSLK